MQKQSLEIQKLKELHDIQNIILEWLSRDLENNLLTSEFVFYKKIYLHISEIFFDVLEWIKQKNMKCYAYSSCVKDEDDSPVLFYRLIIPLKKENK